MTEPTHPVMTAFFLMCICNVDIDVACLFRIQYKQIINEQGPVKLITIGPITIYSLIY